MIYFDIIYKNICIVRDGSFAQRSEGTKVVENIED